MDSSFLNQTSGLSPSLHAGPRFVSAALFSPSPDCLLHSWGWGRGLSSACSSCSPSCSPNPVWGIPEALCICRQERTGNIGHNRLFPPQPASPILPVCPAAPAMTLVRPRSPSSSHEQPGSCVPQDLGKWEGFQQQASAVGIGWRSRVHRNPNLKYYFFFRPWSSG